MIVLLVFVQAVPCYESTFYFDTFLPKVPSRKSEGRKIRDRRERDRVAPREDPSLINVSSRTLSYASGRFPFGERAAALVRSRSAARTACKERGEGSAGSGAGWWQKREEETRDALRDGWNAGVRNRGGIGTHGRNGDRWDTRGARARREGDAAEKKEKEMHRRPNGCDTRRRSYAMSVVASLATI